MGSLLASTSKGASRCLRRHIHSSSSRLNAPSEIPEDQKPLETVSDWTEFQGNRGQFKSLVDTMSQYGSTQKKETTWKLRDSLRRPAPNATVSALLASGAHFGHNSTRMNPNFMPYAYGVRSGITVIDLDHTLPLLRRAANLVRAVAAADGQIIFVGTRPDLRPVVQRAAERMAPQGYHVGDRWLPGTLTNRIKMFGYATTKETHILPDLVILLNPLANTTAIAECAKEHIPTIGIIDTNADPRIVMYPIPANDESTRTAEVIAGVLSIAGREGVALREERERSQKQAAAARQQRIQEEERQEKQRSDIAAQQARNAFDY